MEKIDEATRQFIEQRYGIKGEDIKKLQPNWFKLFAHRSDLARIRTIFEVIDVSHCAVGAKVGDKLVIDRQLINVQESTFPLCINALDRMHRCIFMIFDRIAEGVDPNGLFIKAVDCSDQGLEYGGLGKVRFKIYTEWVDK